MTAAVTKNAIFQCPHAPGLGTIASATPSLKTKTGSIPFVNKTEALTMVIAGCSNVGGGLTPCTALITVIGESTSLKKDSIGVILTNTVMTTNSLPVPGIITITEPQTALNASV